MIEGHVFSENNRIQMKTWLSNCEHKTHPECFEKPDENPELPTRILDLGLGAGSDTINLRLLESDATNIDYVALSYCWGGDEQLQTTIENVSSHVTGILIADLPQTITDTIEVTRFIGLRYLWIDSLCIMQNDPDDVIHNCARMRHYYSNAVLTIVAGNTSKCSQGFLHPIHTSPSNGYHFPFRYPDGFLGSVKFVDHMRVKEPIDDRAWTMQEQLLSRRSLRFGHRIVQWKCKRFQYGLPESMDMLTPIRTRGVGYRSIWERLVAEYTSRNMSNMNDRLPAISGLADWLARDYAKRYADLTPYEKSSISYHAGLWDCWKSHDFKTIVGPVEVFDIRMQLLWYARGHSTDRPREYRAPSWSWAAIDGPISYFVSANAAGEGSASGDQITARVIACETQLASLDAPYGCVMDGYISMKCKLKRYPTIIGHEATFAEQYGYSELDSSGRAWDDEIEFDPHVNLDQLVLQNFTSTSWDGWQDYASYNDTAKPRPQRCPNPIILSNTFGIRYIADTNEDVRAIDAAYHGGWSIWCLEILVGADKSASPRGLLVVCNDERKCWYRVGVYTFLAIDEEGYRQAATYFDDVEEVSITIR